MSLDNYIFFCSHDKNSYDSNKDRAVFSQWRYSKFIENNITFNSGEQYMMYHKAILMNDEQSALKILNVNIYDSSLANESKVNYNKISYIKQLGRKIKNFNQKTWDEHKFNIVKNGNLLKFTQNEDLKKILLSTGNKILIEAAHYDKIWGIGLKEEDAKLIDPNKWSDHGQNLLGQSLMWVRKQIRDLNNN